MKDNDFLDDLYSRSAKDVPPESLDRAILKHARDNVQKGNFLMRRQWQQFLSLAAVMVLSVYIVLDVGDQSMDVEGLSLSEEASEYIEPGFNEKPVTSKKLNKELNKEISKQLSPSSNEMRAKAESFKRKEAKRMAHDELMPLSDQAVEAKEISIQGAAVQGNEEVEGIRAGHSLKASPEKMMEKVERLISEGELAQAKILLQQLSDAYPEFPVPVSIVEALK